MPWRSQNEPSVAEKVCGGLSYFTFGIVGLLYQVFFAKNANTSQLFRFHFFQAVILSIMSMLIAMAVNPLADIALQILRAIAPGAVGPIAGGIGITFTVVAMAFNLLLLYGAVMSFLGKFAEVPFISNVVRQNMRA